MALTDGVVGTAGQGSEEHAYMHGTNNLRDGPLETVVVWCRRYLLDFVVLWSIS
jgi:hypothetical protein